MITVSQTLEEFEVKYPIEQLGDPEKLLFIDIETTGFTARSSYLYLIGCAYLKDGKWRTKQFLAETYKQEINVLDAFFAFSKDFKTLVHFNGNQFDLPFISNKCTILDLPYNFEHFDGIDIYKRISPIKHFLGINSCKQKALEEFLGIDRKDTFSGGELISVYHDYVKNPSDFSKASILLHNEDDLKGMLMLLPLLAYYDMFEQDVVAKKVQSSTYKDMEGKTKSELIIEASIPNEVPKLITSYTNGCYVRCEDKNAIIKVPIYEEEMKYFYARYQDYYYLPEEDLALHKSVATFVEKEHRIQAQASNCYTRKQSKYLPQWQNKDEIVFEPFFRREYKSKEIFFELTDELKRSRSSFSKYANHVLSMIGSHY